MDEKQRIALQRKEVVLQGLVQARAQLDLCEIWHLYRFNVDDKKQKLDDLIQSVKETFWAEFLQGLEGAE
jgi:hypothetical protein